jgi:2-methylaconitate cis-trans-isomerase PrpF
MRRIACVLMRGGTSRGPFFLARDLPHDEATRDEVLLTVLGSPNELQIDGIGGGNSLTSKVAIVSPSDLPGVDLDYEFVQVLIDRRAVDRKPNCGNMLSAVGPFAIEAGLVAAGDPETQLRIRNTNTDTIVDVVVQTPRGQVEYEGDTIIDGVPGSAAPIRMLFADSVGAMTGKLLPAGSPTTRIDAIETTLIDGAIPVMLVRASDLDLHGDELPSAIDENVALLTRLEAMRRMAGKLMGLGDVSGQVVPKIAILSQPRHGGTLAVRYLTPDKCHRALAVTGAVTLAIALLTDGTIAQTVAPLGKQGGHIGFEHPQGMFHLEAEVGPQSVARLSTLRTARRIFEGNLLLPDRVWPQAS